MPGIAIRYQKAAGPSTGSCSPHEVALYVEARKHTVSLPRMCKVTSVQNEMPKYGWYSYTMGGVQPENK